MPADTTDIKEATTRDAASVEAFVRLAQTSVDRLVPDSQIVTSLQSSLERQPDDGDLDQLMRAQQVLARVLCRERTAVSGERLSVGEVEAGLSGRLDFEGHVRVIYELSLLGGRSWPELEKAVLEKPVLEKAVLEKVLEDTRPRGTERGDDPIASALCTLVSGRWRHRRPSVRRAAASARVDPLGFCRLLIEEADEAGEAAPGGRSALSYASILLDDPFLRHDSPRAWFDLRARCAVYLADRSRRLGGEEAFEAQLRALPGLLEAGTGDPDLLALEQELLAARDLAFGDRDAACRRLRTADQLLRDFQPQDRRVEVQLKHALILAADPTTRHLAGEILATATDLFEPLPQDVNPGLRLRLGHARARVELDLARQAVSEQYPLAQEPPSAAALQIYADAWQTQAERLTRARAALPSDDLLHQYGSSRQHAEHDWYLGQSRLVDDRVRAARQLRAARTAFQAMGDDDSADRVSIDLIVCCIVAGASGDRLDDWSEPLRLFGELAARTVTS